MKAAVCGMLGFAAAVFWQGGAKAADCSRQYFVYAEQAIYLGDRVQLGRGPAGARTSAELGVGTTMLGDLVAPQITLRNNALVNGTAYTTSAIAYSAGAKVLIGTKPIGAPQTCTSPTIPSVVPGSGSMNISGAFELPPGHYGVVNVAVGATLVVRTGDYHFQSLTFQPDAKLVTMWDGGTTRLLVGTTLSIGDRHAQSVVGGTGNSTPNALEIISKQTAQLRLGTDTTIVGRVMAPAAEVDVPSRTTILGPLYGKIVRVEPDSIVGKPTGPAPSVCH